MKEFHQIHTCRPTEKEKKGRKIKNHFHSGENCKCFSPFVKVHHHNCPMVLKPCPIHGNEFYSEEKEQNVVISFHPSSKTEKLFQPIKSLLAHCNSGTKINFQYYSPCNSISKDSVKTSYGQKLKSHNLKNSLNSNTFMEKTKSFVAEKTSKVKKLKQCFYSPCNSITQKTRSQTSIKERLNQILRDETKQTRNVFYNLVPEMPPDDKNWFYSNLGGLKNRDKLSDEKMESDFITVTQHDKNNVINHKIFEIKHNKGGNDVPFLGFPRQQTQFVYSSVNVGGPPVVQKTQTTPKEDQKEEGKRKLERNISSSEKTHRSISSSSSGSVYITPFFLVPKGMRDSDSDSKQGKTLNEEFEKVDEAVQANDSNTTKASLITQETQTSPRQSQQLVASKPDPTDYSNDEPKSKSVLLQTEFLSKSSKTSSEESSEPQYASKTTVEEIYVNNERVYSQKRSRAVSEGTDSSQSRSTGVQAGASCLYKEVVISARWGSNTKDKISQTEDNWNLQVSVKAIESKATKSKVSADKEIQTAVSQDSENSEFLHLNSPNVTYVIKPFDELNSDQTIEKHAKTCWGKAHSDSDLYERMRCGCWKTDEDIVPQEEGSKDFHQEKKNPVTTTKIYECVATETETVPKTGNVVLRTKETFERLAVTKETATKDDTPDAVSDLSELKRIIQEFFERSNIPEKKTCNCAEKKPSGDKKPESETKAPKPVEEPKEKQTKDSGAQTDFQVLLNETEQDKSGEQKVKLKHTVPADEENQTKTFYVCTVCGRGTVKYDVGTNTESPKKEDDVKKTSKKDEDGKKSNIDTNEITMKTKKVKGPKPKTDDTKPWKSYDPRDVSQPASMHKTAIPVPVGAPPLRPKNTEKNFSKGRVCQMQLSEERKPKAPSCHNQKIPVIALMEDCICEDIPGPSTAPECVPHPKCYIAQIPSTCSKPVEGRPNRNQGPTQNKKTNSDLNYCVLVAQSWPKDFFAASWNSPKGKGSNTLDDDPISGALNQKRSSEKDVAPNASAKAREPTSCPMFEKSSSPKLLNVGKNGDIQIWFRGKPPCQEEDSYEFNDGPPPTRETSPENLEELNEEFVELSDDDDTPGGNSGLEEEELETGDAEEREEEAEIGERLRQLPRELPAASSVSFQTHPLITFDRSFHSNGPPMSKSLNKFSSSRQPKKKRRT